MTRGFSSDSMKLAGSIVLCLLAGFFGSLFTTPKIAGWYAGLAKPSFQPPASVFGPVWSVLYILMGVALFLVWRKGFAAPGVRIALAGFFVQLVLNASWSYAFFGAESPLAGLVVVIALWLAIVATIALFAKVSRAAAWLLAPYVLWVSFAAVLNAAVCRLNR